MMNLAVKIDRALESVYEQLAMLAAFALGLALFFAPYLLAVYWWLSLASDGWSGWLAALPPLAIIIAPVVLGAARGISFTQVFAGVMCRFFAKGR